VRTPRTSPTKHDRSLLRDRRGAVSTEYVVLVGTMGLVFVAAMLTVGPQLVKDFVRGRDITASPLP
jgi:Flp pilus assembly pilin Flp